MRVDCRLLENIFDRWNVNVHNGVMYNKHSLRVLTRGVLFLVLSQHPPACLLLLALLLLRFAFVLLPSPCAATATSDSLPRSAGAQDIQRLGVRGGDNEDVRGEVRTYAAGPRRGHYWQRDLLVAYAHLPGPRPFLRNCFPTQLLVLPRFVFMTSRPDLGFLHRSPHHQCPLTSVHA